MGGGYWVRVKKFLSVEESEAAEEALVSSVRRVTGPDGQVLAQGDLMARLFEQTLASIVEWNLTDGDDRPLPYDHDPTLERSSGRPSPRRRSLRALPQTAFDKISAVVGGNNNSDPEADARFRQAGAGVHQGGEDDPSGDREVHPGAAVVDDAGGDVGSDPAAMPPGAGGGGVPDVDADAGGGDGEAEAAAETAEAAETVGAGLTV